MRYRPIEPANLAHLRKSLVLPHFAMKMLLRDVHLADMISDQQRRCVLRGLFE